MITIVRAGAGRVATAAVCRRDVLLGFAADDEDPKRSTISQMGHVPPFSHWF